jgi:hypothetical protein
MRGAAYCHPMNGENATKVWLRRRTQLSEIHQISSMTDEMIEVEHKSAQSLSSTT